jgi:hypothetical protein
MSDKSESAPVVHGLSVEIRLADEPSEQAHSLFEAVIWPMVCTLATGKGSTEPDPQRTGELLGGLAAALAGQIYELFGSEALLAALEDLAAQARKHMAADLLDGVDTTTKPN